MRQNIYRYPTSNYDRHKLWVRFKRIDFTWDDSSGDGDVYGRMLANSGANQPSVYLYLPASVSLKDGSNYGTQDLGIVGRSFEKFINNNGVGVQSRDEMINRMSGILGSAVGSIADSVRVAGDIASGGEAVTQGAISLAMRRIPFASGTAFGQGVNSALRTSANPHRRMLFENVNLRDFSFQFEFMPDNADEARQVYDIVKFFRRLAYPTTNTGASDMFMAGDVDQEGKDFLDSFVYKFPSMVAVDMFYRMEDEAVETLQEIARENVQVEDLLRAGGQDDILKSGLYRVGPRIMPCYVTGVEQTLDSQNSMVYRPISNMETADGQRRAGNGFDSPDGVGVAMPTAQTLSVSLSEDRTLDADAIDAGY
jgi:hypothetical protein